MLLHVLFHINLEWRTPRHIYSWRGLGETSEATEETFATLRTLRGVVA